MRNFHSAVFPLAGFSELLEAMDHSRSIFTYSSLLTQRASGLLTNFGVKLLPILKESSMWENVHFKSKIPELMHMKAKVHTSSKVVLNVG